MTSPSATTSASSAPSAPTGNSVAADAESRTPPVAVEFSVVLPCLNEAETLATCIRKATQLASRRSGGRRGRRRRQRVDRRLAGHRAGRGRASSSTSPGAATAPRCSPASTAARGEYVLMADADDSYALDDLGGFLRELRDGADLVMGNRFRGRIEPGAMPFLHRYVGNPVLSMLGRLFFHIPVGDFHCGIRAFRRDRMLALGLVTSGHGVRQRDGGPGVAGRSCGSARCRPRCGPTAARAPRTCAPGATAGGTCASCSPSARAGCCSTRRWCSRLSGWPGCCGCCSGRGRWARWCSTSTACWPSRRCSCSACRGSGSP